MRKTKLTRCIAAAAAVCMLAVLSSCAQGRPEMYTSDNLAGEVSQSGDELMFYYYSDDEGGAVLDICRERGGTPKLMQRISLEKSGEYYTELDFELSFDGINFEDMNFDGSPDLYLPLSGVTENLEGMAWLWDGTKKQYVLSAALSKIPELTVDSAKKCIYGCDYSDGGESRSRYEWNGEKLIRRDID